MLQVSHLSKRYGDNLLFEKVNFAINRGERVGLVGPNGCGKTTLFRLLIGQEKPDSGSVRLKIPARQVGYLPQALEYDQDATARDILGGSREQDESYWADRLQELASALAKANRDEQVALENAYADALERLNEASNRLPEYQMDRVLAGLGLNDIQLDTPVRILSGGQKTRLSLARLLLKNPSLLLLDEPTNHLDISALEWLEGYLSRFTGAMLIVSHDRTFLDHTVTRVLEMNDGTHKVTSYAGTYSDYAQAKAREREKTWQTYKEQQGRIGRLKRAIGQLKGRAGKIEHETIHYHYRKIAKKVARQATVRQRRLQRMLDSEEHVEKPEQGWEMKIEFVNTPPSGQDVLVCEGLTKRYGEHLLFADVNLVLRRGERIALTGPNGSGKTTLLRLIVGKETASSGLLRLGANVRVGYYSQEQETLDWDLTLLESVRQAAPLSETEARSFLHYFLFAGDAVFTPVRSLSYGERARLALGVLVLQGCNLLLLDEPINHLDIPSRERFEQALSTFEGTVLAVVHDRYFIERFVEAIWLLRDQTITRHIDLNRLPASSW